MIKFLEQIKHFWTASIRRQLMLGIALVHAVLMTIFVIDLTNRQRTFLHLQGLEHTISLSETLATNSSSWVLANDVIGLEEVTISQSKYPRLKYAMLISPEGRILSHTDTSNTGLFLADEISLQLLKFEPETRILVESDILIDVAAPVFVNEKFIAWARVGLGQENVVAGLKLIARDGVFYTLIAIVVGLLFAFFMAAGMTKSIRQLNYVAEGVQKGNKYLRAKLNRKDELGQVANDLNLMLDVIESEVKAKEAVEHLLTNRNAEFQAMFDSIPDAVIFADTERKIRMINPGVTRLFGYDANQLIGHTTEMLYANPEEFSMEGKKRYNTASNVKKNTYEIKYKRKDSSVFWSETLGTQVVTDTNEVIGFVGLIRDITERKNAHEAGKSYQKELEKRVRERTRELTAKNRDLESFSYSIAHDLRAPLRSITSFAQIIAEDANEKLNDEERDFLKRIIASGKNMSALISDILNLAQLSRTALEISHINLSNIVLDILERYQKSHPERDVTWNISPDITAYVDSRLINMVLENILGNAWKFTQQKTKTFIEFKTEETDAETIYAIKDNGIGFNMNYADKLFLPFSRLHKQDEVEGTGIGLATVKRIVEMHHGRVWADSAPNQGCTIFFALPKF